MKLKVKENGELLSYLYDNLDMPKKKIKQYLTHGSIYVNNVKTRQYNYPLINGMEIVIDTDNLSEHFTGFFTLHGDVGILSPFSQLWKTEIPEMIAIRGYG